MSTYTPQGRSLSISDIEAAVQLIKDRQKERTHIEAALSTNLFPRGKMLMGQYQGKNYIIANEYDLEEIRSSMSLPESGTVKPWWWADLYSIPILEKPELIREIFAHWLLYQEEVWNVEMERVKHSQDSEECQ